MTATPEPHDTPLCLLALQHSTDKAPRSGHGYTPYYHSLFADRRDAIRKVFEIGIDVGASLRMWRDYFPNALIYAMDCDTSKLFQEERIRTFVGDQGDPSYLGQAVDALGLGIDLILDDGSHEPAHQILSAKYLVPLLAPDGVYIIEDVLHPKWLQHSIPYVSEIVSFDTVRDPYNNLIVIRGGQT